VDKLDKLDYLKNPSLDLKNSFFFGSKFIPIQRISILAHIMATGIIFDLSNHRNCPQSIIQPDSLIEDEPDSLIIRIIMF